MDETFWVYEKLMEDGTIKLAPVNDFDGSITGHIVFGVSAWLDENPEEARRLGWVKHIEHNIAKYIEYDRQRQYLMLRHKIIDEYTYEDEYVVLDKTEDMMRQEEEASATVWSRGDMNVGGYVTWL